MRAANSRARGQWIGLQQSSYAHPAPAYAPARVVCGDAVMGGLILEAMAIYDYYAQKNYILTANDLTTKEQRHKDF